MAQDVRPPHPNLLDLRNPSSKPVAKSRKKYPVKIFVLVSVVVIAVVVGLLLATKFHKKEDLNSVLVIKKRVAKLMILPKEEEPALLTITDKSKVSTPFLSVSENGDKLLVYQTAQRAILYRPSIDRIVDVGPVSIAGPEGQ